MTRVKIVSGYVPLPKNPRPLEDYAASGARINSLRAPKAVFTQSLESCWLYKFLQTTGPVTHSQGKWPLKNTLDYMIVQHQKFEWIACAAGDDTGNADVFVWIDYGVFCQGPAITEQIIESFLHRMKPETRIVYPGNFNRIVQEVPEIPGEGGDAHWRFCGTVLIVPRNLAETLFIEARANVAQHIEATRNVSWEVNTLARIEVESKLPFAYYHSHWGTSLFDNYPKGVS